MAPITMSGLSSVSDRTLFTNHAPIVKKPLPILTGSDLIIKSNNTVQITSANFSSFDVGKDISITGSLSGRNDGTFPISSVLNSVTIELSEANFDMTDEYQTLVKLVSIINELKSVFNNHLNNLDFRLEYPYMIHDHNDVFNVITGPDVSSISGCISVLNEIRGKFTDHILNISDEFHKNIDGWNVIISVEATNLYSSIVLANELKNKYEMHRVERRSHGIGDAKNKIQRDDITVAIQSVPGQFVGPFNWIVYDSRRGMVADSVEDVVVRVNGTLVEVENVFGMVGAVVLKDKPVSTDSVVIDYDYLNNPPARFLKMNSPEFVLNQDKNNGIMGFPSHKYRARSYLINPGHTPDLISSVSPYRSGWKYKSYERSYASILNDPSKLLLNSPINKIKYPVLNTFVYETTINYDPVVLPQNSDDKWVLKGEGEFFVSDGLLTIRDFDIQNSLNSQPPFYTKTADIIADSIVSAAFRVRIDEYLPDGVFTGVGFGLSDGFDVIFVGFIKTYATNLSSSIFLINDIKLKFNSHIFQPTVHGRHDSQNILETIVDASDLQSLIILLNYVKLKFNSHVNKADPTLATIEVHKDVDSLNEILSDDAYDLDSSVILVNELRDKIDSHRTSIGIHFVDDVYNEIELVSQVGILKNSGAYEFQENWESYAIDWSRLQTYRIHRNPNGDVKLYMSGDIDPVIEVSKSLLPSISDFSGKFDPVQQVFFGSISKEATSLSTWNLIRVNINPVNSKILKGNKVVQFDCTKQPELDLVSPWITLGHGGIERIYDEVIGGLQLDSTWSISKSDNELIGKSSGAFRGFMRYEPILSSNTTCVVEFESSIDFHTFGLSNRACGVFIDDDKLSVHFAFLYFSPSPASVVGSSSTFSINSSDDLLVNLDGNNIINIKFSSVLTTAGDVASVINSFVGSNIADDDGFNHVRIIYGVGSSSYITIIGGSAVLKLGLIIGKYFGKDSNPEPRVSWFSEAPPDSMDIPWVKYGGSLIQMIGAVRSPVMRINDMSTTDYTAFSMMNPIVVTDVMEPQNDWKLDARFTVIDFTPGSIVPGTIPLIDLHFSGALINVDEGQGGKNLELHCAVDSSNNKYLNLVTYDLVTDSLIPISQYTFNWDDGRVHSFSVFTNKGADQLFVYADGELLIPTAGVPVYSSLGSSTGLTPSITFGSGGEEISNTDLRTSTSTIDWESVCIFKDSKLSDPVVSSKRHVGIFKGGDPSLLSSWYLSNVDWSSFHSYRIVRDPSSHVDVYIDGNQIPSISVSYDSVRLPPFSSSFLSTISNNRQVVAWGSFDPMEISRARIKYFNYGMGKITLTDRIVPPYHVLNHSNAMASPEHLKTIESHKHFGFNVYSGGTPTDDFMSNVNVESYTVLGEGIPPVPKTQNLESRGGLIRFATSMMDVPVTDFIDFNGIIGQFYDDTNNGIDTNSILTEVQTLNHLINLANDISLSYENHRVRHDVSSNVHNVDDVINVISTPAASDLPTLINRLVDFKSTFNFHVTDGISHVPIDPQNLLDSSDPVDLQSCIILINEAINKYNNHISNGFYHLVPGVPPYFDNNLVTAPDASNYMTLDSLLNGGNGIKRRFTDHSLSSSWHRKTVNYSITLNYAFVISLVNHIKYLYNQHIELYGTHAYDDSTNIIILNDAYNISTAISLANDIKSKFNSHIGGQYVHDIIGEIDRYFSQTVLYPYDLAIQTMNIIIQKYNLHIKNNKSHVEIDHNNVVKINSVTNITELIDASNSVKSHFNLHMSSYNRGSKVHVKDDTVNFILSPDAMDLDSSITVMNEFIVLYNSHLVQTGVHGTSAFIRLEPPGGVLYESMKFWVNEVGTKSLVSPFSDDETWHIDSINNKLNKSLVYDGTLLPEQATLVSINANPISMVSGETFIMEVDRNPPVTVVFQSSDITVLNVVNRINSFIPGIASVEGTEIRLTSSTVGGNSSIIINGGSSVGKLGFLVPYHSPWFIISENPSDVSVISMSSGGESFVRYGISDNSVTKYVNKINYPNMPSVGFEFSIKIRINFNSVVEDSGIYAGLSGLANVYGYAIAIGWGGVLSNRYVKVQDMNSGEILNKVPLDWYDGNFHTYVLSYDEINKNFKLTIDQ